jgi:hypothetical protein
MNEGDLSKRMDDLHRRFDDLRADMNQRFADLRADMNQRFDSVNLRLTEVNQSLRIFMWIVSGWFTFLTAVLAVFGFLRR